MRTLPTGTVTLLFTDAILAAIAQSLGIREVSGQPLVERLKDELQRKQILLLLDNFEQVVSAAVRRSPSTNLSLSLFGERKMPGLTFK